MSATAAFGGEYPPPRKGGIVMLLSHLCAAVAWGHDSAVVRTEDARSSVEGATLRVDSPRGAE
jgi:hypothetical protein